MQEGAPRRSRQIRGYQPFGMRFGEGKMALVRTMLQPIELFHEIHASIIIVHARCPLLKISRRPRCSLLAVKAIFYFDQGLSMEAQDFGQIEGPEVVRPQLANLGALANAVLGASRGNQILARCRRAAFSDDLLHGIAVVDQTVVLGTAKAIGAGKTLAAKRDECDKEKTA